MTWKDALMWSGRTISLSPSRSNARLRLAVAVAAMVAWGVAGKAAEARDILTVTMDKAKLVKYPANTETIIIGNPIVADVTMLKSSGLLVVTGKGYGETNLLLLDKAGTILWEANLRVEPSDALLVVQRGTDRESYACHPRCEPTVSIGDATTFISNAGSAITTRNGLAVPAAAGPSPATPH